jgi:hypothetical protein
MSVIILGHKYSIAHITYLDLEGQQLERIPPEVLLLKNLDSINLSNNYLKHIPRKLIMLQKLTSIDVSNNELREMPVEILQMPKLRMLYTYNNPLFFITPKMYQNNLPEMKHMKDTYLKIDKVKEFCAREKICAFFVRYVVPKYYESVNDCISVSI